MQQFTFHSSQILAAFWWLARGQNRKCALAQRVSFFTFHFSILAWRLIVSYSCLSLKTIPNKYTSETFKFPFLLYHSHLSCRCVLNWRTVDTMIVVSILTTYVTAEKAGRHKTQRQSGNWDIWKLLFLHNKGYYSPWRVIIVYKSTISCFKYLQPIQIHSPYLYCRTIAPIQFVYHQSFFSTRHAQAN